MDNIFEKTSQKVGKYMSKRASVLLSIFGWLAVVFLGLSKVLPDSFESSANTLFYLFLVSLSLIPISFIISWISDLKHEMDMRIVIDEELGLPQSAIFSKKEGHKYRRITKEERKGWEIDNKKSLKAIIKGLMVTTQEKLEEERLNDKLCDPDLPYEEYKRIRNEQIRRKK